MLINTLFNNMCFTVICLRVVCFNTMLNIYKWLMSDISKTVGDRDKRFAYF